MVAGRTLRELAKSAATNLVEMAMCMARDTPRWCLRKISELENFGKNLRGNSRGRSERRYGSGNDNIGGEYAVPIALFLLVEVGI